MLVAPPGWRGEGRRGLLVAPPGWRGERRRGRRGLCSIKYPRISLLIIHSTCRSIKRQMTTCTDDTRGFLTLHSILKFTVCQLVDLLGLISHTCIYMFIHVYDFVAHLPSGKIVSKVYWRTCMLHHSLSTKELHTLLGI